MLKNFVTLASKQAQNSVKAALPGRCSSKFLFSNDI